MMIGQYGFTIIEVAVVTMSYKLFGIQKET